ncbi:hypothetical protein TRFO_38118 [Tritrichomonas foetus]|uniref:Uncharacterized protein n=1 Tax=Tritrichomonas foetus TaxID=1144522 RepID=A0A1J4JAR4_9EUKA|nr:hypothetical protein TRFO_38118 [Tritrichomonas foetus]|eukprot:OHS95761.1 hypothetical protein TRFO_38118 [Tritrichomonas foetus]
MYNPNARRGPPRPIAFLYKVEFPDERPCKIHLPTKWKDLLDLAETELKLKRPVKQILNESGTPYTSIESIPPHASLYISCATPYAEEPIYKSRLPLKSVSNHFLNLPTVKQPKPKPKRDDAVQHQVLAASPQTVQENMRDALLTLFASMTPEQKAALPASDKLTKLANDTGYYSLEHSLLSQFIGPSSVIFHTEIGKLVNTWIIDHLKGLKPQDCKFIIAGPSKSGKSTLLMSSVMMFYQKLQIAGEASNYLIFPLNWSLYTIFLDDISKLYTIFVTLTMESLKSTKLNLIPIIAPLQQWFLSLITVLAFSQLPPIVIHYPGISTDSIINVGLKIHKAWNSKSGLEDFLISIARLPIMIAHAFGLKNCVYVFDHFDACGYMIEPIDRFRESEYALSLSNVICDALSNAIYFVASLDDTEFFANFTLQDYRQLSTERLINLKSEEEIMIAQPPVTINMDLCRGCPAYCATFQRLCQMIRNTNEKTAVKNQFSKMKSIVDASRKTLLRQEVFRFCTLLAQEYAEDVLTPEVLNGLEDRAEYDIRIR